MKLCGLICSNRTTVPFTRTAVVVSKFASEWWASRDPGGASHTTTASHPVIIFFIGTLAAECRARHVTEMLRRPWSRPLEYPHIVLVAPAAAKLFRGSK